tara:strand:+ start:2425 stop:5985 length:3561 start_codon:yes stop_codon:yes gene_type:complete
MINKRIFGADIPILVKKKLEARQLVAEGGKNPLDSIDSNYKDERKESYKYNELINSDFEMEADLSSRTPFVRMWTAVSLVRPLDSDTDELSAEDYNKLTQEEKQGYKVLSKKIYVVGSNNLSTVDSIDESNQSKNTEEEINYALFPSELGVDKDHNKFMKPQAGITGLSSETGGTLGSIKTTEVKFVVHNFADYDEIYNKYFLRPGAQIFVDFGWNKLRNKLYNPINFLDNSDGLGIESKLYGQKDVDKGVKEDGFVTENAGDVETLIGIVTGYDSKILENGSFECSIELTSKNSALNFAPKTPTENIDVTNAKFEHEIELLTKFEAIYKLADKDDRTNILSALKKADAGSGAETEAKLEAYIEELAFNSFGSDDFNPTMLGLDSGIFLVGDDATSTDQYIAWGLLEDRILNKYFGHGDDEEAISSENKEKLEVALDSSKSFTTYQYGFNQKQQDVKNPPSFVVPEFWDKSYSNPLTDQGGKAGKSIKERQKDFLANGTVSTESEFGQLIENARKAWLAQIPNITYDNNSSKRFKGPYPISDFDKELNRIPLREIFVNVDIVKKAFTNSDNTTFKAVVTEILDTINEDSYGIWNWIMAGVGDDNRLAIIDTNQLGIAESKKKDKFEKMFVFKVMGKDSIVTSYDVSLEMPAGEIGSMYAIQAMSGTSKKLYPISTMIEKQSALQSLLSKVGEDSNDVRFRYLPDIAPYNAMQQAEGDAESMKFSKLYRESADIIGAPAGAKAGYGNVFKTNDTFNTYFKGKLDEDDPMTEEINQKIIEKNEQLMRDNGYQVVETVEEKWKLYITGVYQASGFAKPMPLPMKLTLKIYGIASLKPGDIFKVDYLPQVYLERVYFQIISVSHEVDSNGWYTTLETQFRIRPDKIDDPNIIGAPTTTKLSDIKVDENNKTQKEKYKPADIKIAPAYLTTKTSIDTHGIDDSMAYRWKSKYKYFTTFCDDPYTSTYHIPDDSPFWDDEWSAMGNGVTTTGATMKVKKRWEADDGFFLSKGQLVDLNQNLATLKPRMNLIESVPCSKFNHIKILYTFMLVGSRPVYISNPMYYWDIGNNRYNGYGYSRIFYENKSINRAGRNDTAMDRAFVRGIYKPGEKLWFGVAGDLKRHWFVAPTGQVHPGAADFRKNGQLGSWTYGTGQGAVNTNTLKNRYDISPFDVDWTFGMGGEKETESGPTID